MTVRVRLFASIREALGRETVDLAMSQGATAEDVWRELVRLDPAGALPARRVNLAAAVNRKYTRFDVPLQEGDEVVFIPPVSGG